MISVIINPNGKHEDREHLRSTERNVLQEAVERGLSRYCEPMIDWVQRLNKSTGRQDTKLYSFEDFSGRNFTMA